MENHHLLMDKSTDGSTINPTSGWWFFHRMEFRVKTGSWIDQCLSLSIVPSNRNTTGYPLVNCCIAIDNCHLVC